MSLMTKIFFEIPQQPIDYSSFCHIKEIINESYYKKIHEDLLKIREFHKYWNEIPQEIKEYTPNVLEAMRIKFDAMIETTKRKITKDIVVKRPRMKNRSVNLKKIMGTLDEIEIKQGKWDKFTQKYTKKIKKWQKRVKEVDTLLTKKSENKNYYNIKYRSGNFSTTKRFTKSIEKQYFKLQAAFHNDVELLEKAYHYFMGLGDFSMTQKKMHEQFKNRYKETLSFKKFRALMSTLDIRYKNIKNYIPNNLIAKRQRLYFLNKLIELHTNDAKNLLYFDVTSFNWDKKSKKSWNYRLNPTGFESRKDFSPLHMLTIINLNGIVAFQLVRESMTSTHIFNFLHDVFKSLRTNRSERRYHLILDNSGLHKTISMKNLCIRMQVFFHFIVPRNPFFNLIEYVFRFIKASNKSFFLCRKSIN